MKISTAKHFQTYSVGIVCAGVCTDMDVEEATNQLNQEHPTGIASRWELSKDKTFKSGEPMPCPCEQNESFTHYLFNC